MQNYARLPVSFVRGEGALLFDAQGNQYLDAIGGLAVCLLGHAHPAVTAAITGQAKTLLHTSNLYQIDLQQTLADELTVLTGMQNAFFCNSGAEANEAAIKIARLFGHAKDIAVPVLLVTDNAFHGRTLAALSATGNPKLQQGFEPLVEGFQHVPYNDLDAMATAMAADSNIVGVLVEPVQGEAGVNVPDKDYLTGIRALCDKHGLLMMLDEVQTGCGRTGRFLACQHEHVVPDVVTLAKGLGNGVPIGACLARGQAASLLTAGTHGSTFGGNPLACAAALAVLNTLASDDLVTRAAVLGERMLSGFKARLGDSPAVSDIRGMGLMIGIQLAEPCAELVSQALQTGLLINVAGGDVIRLLPPLVMSDEQADQILETVCQLVGETVSA